MKTIKLIHLYITNFMGCDVFESDFSDLTTIEGRNASGKSTVFNAFLWLLFGKNSKDQTSFDIKNTVDRSRNRQDHNVTATLSIDGNSLKLSRTYKEKWVKKRGEEQAEFSGHETEYHINDVPVSLAEFKSKVDAICPENVFKMITNVHYFNEIPWQDRRTILTEIAGDVSDQDIIQTNRSFAELMDYLSGKTLAEFKRESAAMKKKIKEGLEEMPARISEAHRAKLPEHDYTEIETQIRGIDQKIESLERDKENVAAAFQSASDRAIKAQQELNELKRQVLVLEGEKNRAKDSRIQECKNQINEINNQLSGLESKRQGLNTRIQSIENEISRLNSDNERLRHDWTKTNAQQCPELTDGQKACPSCKREWESDKLDSIREIIQNNHIAEKQRALADINSKGKKNNELIEQNEVAKKALTAELEKVETEIPALTQSREDLKIRLSEIENLPVEDPAELIALRQRIETFIVPLVEKIDTTELNSQLVTLRQNREELVKKSSVKEINIQQDRRILELQDREKTLASELANLEKREAIGDAFIRAKNEEVERRVNSMFRSTTFRMFETQVNGGQAEACVALYNGVPYNVVNTAGKINMGIDIINVLCKHYGISAPVFIDNTESVNKLDECVSQIIKLQVTDSPVLRVQHQPIFEFAN